MKILLTFTGFHDPYAKGLLGQEEQTGPILSLVSESHFDLVILFSTPNTKKNTTETKAALLSLYLDLKIDVRELYSVIEMWGLASARCFRFGLPLTLQKIILSLLNNLKFISILLSRLN